MKTTANIAGVKPSISGSLLLRSGTVTLSDRDFLNGSIKFRGGTSESSEFTVGAAIIGGLDFTLINDDGRFSGLDWFDSRVSISLTINGTDIAMGTYYVVKHYERGNVVTVECHDALKILDEYQIYEDEITWPADSAEVAAKIASRHGLSVSGLTSGIQIPDPGNDMMTERECIAYIGQIQGKYVRVHNTVISFEWYNTADVHDAGTTFSHDLRTDDIEITGVKVTTSDGTKTETRGESGYMLTITSNPFITADNVAAIADKIGAAVTGIKYRPGDVSIMSNPAIEPGDVLRVNTGQETGVIVIASTVTYTVSRLQESITSDAEPYSGDLRIKRKDYIKNQAQQAIDDELKNPDSNLSQALGGSGDSPLHGWFTGQANTACKVTGHSFAGGSVTEHASEAATINLMQGMIVVPRYGRLQACMDYYNGTLSPPQSTPVEGNMYFEIRLEGKLTIGSTSYTVVLSYPRCTIRSDSYTIKGSSILLGSCVMHGALGGNSIIGTVTGLPMYLISRDEKHMLWKLSSSL